jgi:hypothetical protein
MITRVSPTAMRMMTAGPDNRPWMLDVLANDVFFSDVPTNTSTSAKRMANSRKRTSFKMKGVFGFAVAAPESASSRCWLTRRSFVRGPWRRA